MNFFNEFVRYQTYLIDLLWFIWITKQNMSIDSSHVFLMSLKKI